jgi:hypothetical protein
LDYKEIQAFETSLRKAIEQSELRGAEALIRASLRDAPDELLQEVFDRPLDRLHIRDWDNIAADMEDARRLVPDGQLEREWAAVLLGLINRNDVAGLPISVKFTFVAEPQRVNVGDRPTYMTEAQFEAWKADNQDRIFLPNSPSFPAYRSASRPYLQGLEELRRVHDRGPAEFSAETGRDAVLTARSIAAAIVLLRFHQLVERYAKDPGLPQPLRMFAYVDTAIRPMETNTIDYGTQATRLLTASTRHYDPPATARVADRVRAEREAALLAETRQLIAAVREFHLALSLWPSWQNREERFRFSLLADAYLGQARAAVARGLPNEVSHLVGEKLCERFAHIRLGKNAARALSSSEPIERTGMHRLGIAYARKFGGPKVNEALAHVPPPPEGLLRSGDYGL